MSPIQYGWVDCDGGKHTDMAHFAEKYMLQIPNQLLESCLGVCWDQVELQRKLFANTGKHTRSFFIVYYDGDKCPTHTFILFEYNNKIFWHEHARAALRGLHEYDNLRSAISDVHNKFINNELSGKYSPQNLVIYEYDAPRKNLSCIEFYKHCERGKQIQIDSL
ncbi:MAG: hypothetical protein Q4A79_02540 [Candidatus Saccharibacteria bacterium]|nr:hypothetical protein [Candidatus Saccharibacteria bacterium]